MCWCYKWSDSSHQPSPPLPASVFIRKFQTEIFLFTLRARTDRDQAGAEDEQIPSVCSSLSTGAPIFLPASKDKLKLSNNCLPYSLDIKYELVTFEILSLVMWRAVATCEEVTSPLLSGIFIPEEIGLSWTERRVPAGQWLMLSQWESPGLITRDKSWVIWFYVLLMSPGGIVWHETRVAVLRTQYPTLHAPQFISHHNTHKQLDWQKDLLRNVERQIRVRQ